MEEEQNPNVCVSCEGPAIKLNKEKECENCGPEDGEMTGEEKTDM